MDQDHANDYLAVDDVVAAFAEVRADERTQHSPAGIVRTADECCDECTELAKLLRELAAAASRALERIAMADHALQADITTAIAAARADERAKAASIIERLMDYADGHDLSGKWAGVLASLKMEAHLFIQDAKETKP